MDRSRHSPIIVFWFLFILAAVSVTSFARIEYLNWQLGSVLPRKPNDSGFVPKWRARVRSRDEALTLGSIERENGPETSSDHQGAGREALKWDALRWWVAGPGLLNYVVTIPLFVYFAVIFCRSANMRHVYAWIACLAAFCVALVAIMTFYRDYFGSLGW